MSYTVYYYVNKRGEFKNDVYLDGNKFVNSLNTPVRVKRCSIEEYQELINSKLEAESKQTKLF